MKGAMVFTILALLLACTGIVSAAAKEGTLCKPPGAIEGDLVCTARTGQGAIWMKSAAPTTTMTPTTPPTTSTTLPGVPPLGGPTQIRLSPCHLGLRSRDPSDRKYDPRTGQPGNQYLAKVQAEQKIHELMPRGIRIMRATPECAGKMTGVMENARTNVPSRLFWRYGIRTLRGGQAYPFTVADYNHNYPRTFFTTFCGCVPVEAMTLEWKQVCSTPTNNLGGCPAILPHLSGPMSGAGTLVPNRPGPPLTATQCAALEAAVTAHHAKASDTRAKLAAFANSARDTDQLALFDLFFVADTDPLHTPVQAEALTRLTMTTMDEWKAAFMCGTGSPPVVERVLTTSWKHARAHWLRAVAGLVLANICDGQIDQCGESGS